VTQHRPTGSETTPPYAPRSSRFGSELPSVEDDVDIWHYAIVSCMPEMTTTTTVGTNNSMIVNKTLCSLVSADSCQMSIKLYIN